MGCGQMGIRATDTASLHLSGSLVPGGLSLQVCKGHGPGELLGVKSLLREPAVLSPVVLFGTGEMLCQSCVAFASLEPLLSSCAAQK